MKKIVIYKSRTGFTKKYAEWIAEDIKADIFRVQDIKKDTLMDYDIIIYCGGLYAGGILGFSFIKKNFNDLTNKKIIVVAVGATTTGKEAEKEVKNKNFPPVMNNKISFFLLRGGLDYKKMKISDKFLMWLLVKSLKLKKYDDLDDDSKGIIATYGKVVDFTNRNTIKPIIDFINKD